MPRLRPPVLAAIWAVVVVAAVAFAIIGQGRVRLAGVGAVAGLLALGAYYTHRTFGFNRVGIAVGSWFRRHPSAVAFAVAVSAAALAVVVVKWAPEWLASTKDLTENEAAQERGRVRTALLAVLAGLLAALGAYYTHRTFGLNRAGQITERFTRAIDQLGSTHIDVRLGGIYALERVAHDSKADHRQVVEVLTAFVRECTRWHPNKPPAAIAQPRDPGAPDKEVEAIRAIERIARGADPHTAETPTEQPASADQTAPQLATDVQAAMSVVARRDPSRDRAEARLDLVRTELRQVVLLGDEAHLERANLEEAHLDGANLRGAHFEEADLAGANLGGAYLGIAHFEGANLKEANLKEAFCWRANLGGANLEAARLDGANLGGAHLEGANLQGTRPELANLKLAHYDNDTTWPEGFDYRAAGARHVDEEEQPSSVPPSG